MPPTSRTPPQMGTIAAAVDVGTNAVRLELVRRFPDGTRETMHQERDPVRPGEGVFNKGEMSADAENRLVATLRRYAVLCRRHHADVRAVATSAMREAGNSDRIIRRVAREAGLHLEIISGTEEARLICLGVLEGRPPRSRTVCIDIGGGSTEVALAQGERPTQLWSVALGAVRLIEVFGTDPDDLEAHLALLREYAKEAVGRTLPKRLASTPRTALGSSGTIRTIVRYAAAEGTAHLTRPQLHRAVDELGSMTPEERREYFEPNRADIVVPGAVILEAVANHLKLDSITAVERGLRHGVIVDLVRRQQQRGRDPTLVEAALQLGKRMQFDELHAMQVRRLALTLFDELEALHKLPNAARPYLEIAALLHDIGHSVSYNRHHKHTYYLLSNADLAGMSDHEREIVARIARFHRRSFPDSKHLLMADLSVQEQRMVRRLAMLLRVADALDRSHRQPVQRLRVKRGRSKITLELQSRTPPDLELWDVARERASFRKVFGRTLAATA